MENIAMILQVKNLSKSFDGFAAVVDVSLQIDKGTLCSIIGPNGAGKSTLFNLITGHLSIDEGSVVFNGIDITRMKAHKICRLGLGRSFQRVNIFPRLTVFENIQSALLAHMGRSFDLFSEVSTLFQEETDEILEMVGLNEFRHDHVI